MKDGKIFFSNFCNNTKVISLGKKEANSAFVQSGSPEALSAVGFEPGTFCVPYKCLIH